MKFCPKCGRGFLLGIYCVHDDAELIVNRCESCYREYDVDVLHCEDDGNPLPVFLQGPKQPAAPEEELVQSTEPDNPDADFFEPSEPMPETEASDDAAPEKTDFTDPEITPEPISSTSPEPVDEPKTSSTPGPKATVSAFDAVPSKEEVTESPEPSVVADEELHEDTEDEKLYDEAKDPKEGLTELIKTSATRGEFTFGIVGAMIFGGCTYWGFSYATLSDWADNFLCIWICPGFTALTALLLLFHAFYARGKAMCPHCGEWVTGFVHGTEIVHEPELCDSCGNYCRGKGVEIWKVPTDYVAEDAAFQAALVDNFQVPEICCECGEAATRTMGVDWTIDDAFLVSFTCKDPDLFKINPGGKSGEFMAPYCQKHHSGCELKSTTERPFSIYVQSHKFHLDFCELNDTRPRKKD